MNIRLACVLRLVQDAIGRQCLTSCYCCPLLPQCQHGAAGRVGRAAAWQQQRWRRQGEHGWAGSWPVPCWRPLPRQGHLTSTHPPGAAARWAGAKVGEGLEPGSLSGLHMPTASKPAVCWATCTQQPVADSTTSPSFMQEGHPAHGQQMSPAPAPCPPPGPPPAPPLLAALTRPSTCE